MRIKTVRLKHFKRFDDLTINLGKSPQKIIALVGPNGCGKSSIFDAFEQRQRQFKGSSRDPSPSFFSKLLYSIFPEKQSNATLTMHMIQSRLKKVQELVSTKKASTFVHHTDLPNVPHEYFRATILALNFVSFE